MPKYNDQEIMDILQGIKSVVDIDDLRKLETVAKQMHESGPSENTIDYFFGVFERFPNEDGFGIFWTILHGLEKSPGYENHLIQSVQRQPAIFSLRMISRIINSGKQQFANTDLLSLLKNIAEDKSETETIRRHAQQIIEKL